jgi:hypothetical protein
VRTARAVFSVDAFDATAAVNASDAAAGDDADVDAADTDADDDDDDEDDEDDDNGARELCRRDFGSCGNGNTATPHA